MFSGVIYFAGPRTRWPGRDDRSRIHPSEIIATTPPLPWRWLARRTLLATFNALDPTRCGYALMHGDDCVEHYDPPLPVPHAD